MEFILNAFVAGLVLATAYGFMYNPRCDVDPASSQTVGRGTGIHYEKTVPSDCHNGTMTWSYPFGHLLLYFPNPHGATERVCLQDWALGDTYNVTDITDGRHTRLANVTRANWVCTASSTSKELVLKFDAPNVMYYTSGFVYRVSRH